MLSRNGVAISWWVDLLIGVGGGLALGWLALIVVLVRHAPPGEVVGEGMRLLPDTLRLLSRLARDRELPRGVRIRLWVMLAYLASPLDLIPDVIPVIGYADDVIIVALVLRSVVRRSGEQPLVKHWPGTARGLTVIRSLAGVTPDPRPAPDDRSAD